MAEAIEKGALAASKAQFIGNVPESSRYGGETIRDKARGALFNLGIDRRGVNTLIGDMRADNIIDNIGLVDLTPVALPAVIQEGARSLKQGDYVSGIVDLAFSALEMAPGFKLASPYVKKLIKIIANKANKAAPVDETKRKLMQGGLAAPIVASSGILSQLPIGKINEVVPVIKKILPLPKSLYQIPALIRQTDDAIETGFRENIDMFDNAEAKEIIDEIGFDRETLEKLGIDPDNIDKFDLLNDEVVWSLKKEPMMNPNAYLDEEELYEGMLSEIDDYLDGVIEFDDLDSGSGGAYNLIKSLQDDYGLNKEGIRKYLKLGDK